MEWLICGRKSLKQTRSPNSIFEKRHIWVGLRPFFPFLDRFIRKHPYFKAVINLNDLKAKLALLLITPVGIIDFLREKRSVVDIGKRFAGKNILGIYWLRRLELKGLIESELAVTTEATPEKKGRAERLFWVTPECLHLYKRLNEFLITFCGAYVAVYDCPKCDFIGWTPEQAKQHHEETGH